MAALDSLRALLLRSTRGIVAWNTLANQANRFRLRAGADVDLVHGDPRTPEDADALAGYVLHMWADIRRWLDARGFRVEGRRVLELGPGENNGLLLCALADGAATAVGIDKFTPRRDPAFSRLLHRALRARLDPARRARLDAVVPPDDPRGEPDPTRLQEYFDCPVETAADRLPEGAFDLVFSRSVLEYVKDLHGTFRGLRALLANEGCMIHKVDLRDDGLFSSHGLHPLTFLTLSPAVYRAMTSHAYRPGQARLPAFRDAARAAGLRAEFHPCRVLGHARDLPEPVPQLLLGRDYSEEDLRLLRAVRPRLHPAFAGMSDGDLLTTGFHLVAWR